MRSRRLDSRNGRMFAVVLDPGDEVLGSLTAFAAEQRLAASQLTAIGALSSVVLGYFDRARKDYRRIAIADQVEVLSLAGNITERDGKHTVHAHLVAGRADASACGGHLLEGHVWPTLEVVVIESPKHLVRRFDESTGLALLAL